MASARATIRLADIAAIVLVLGCCAAVPAATAALTLADWEKFLSRSDPIFSWQGIGAPPTKWYESAFTGNGALGMMVRATQSPIGGVVDGLRIDIGRTDIYDDRISQTPGTKGDPSANRTNFACDAPRLPLGIILAHFASNGSVALNFIEMRIDLFNGEVRGSVGPSGGGRCDFELWSNAEYTTADVSAIKVNCSQEANVTLTWVPHAANSTWAAQCQGYKYNPAPETVTTGDITTTTQMHLSGTSHGVGKTEVRSALPAGRSETILFLSVVNVSKTNAAPRASAEVQKAIKSGYSALHAGHRRWWNQFYTRGSFLSISDTLLESFYWTNMYKLASATRQDRVVYDLMGPWYIEGTNWPDLHWDLNVQLTYWPLFTANKIDMVASLTNLLNAQQANLISNVPMAMRADSAAAPSGASALTSQETCYWNYGKDCLTSPPTVTGNLAWAMQLWHNIWLYTRDDQVLKELYPLLRRTVNFYQHLQTKSAADGYLHLPPTFSPEYAAAPDCNYDNALYRYALTALVETIKTLGLSDPLAAQYRLSLQQLAPPPVKPVGAEYPGFQIGAGVPLSHGHRHFSHLFMIFPLKQLNFSDTRPATGDMALAAASIDHWLGMTSGLTGFCRTAASSMNVLLGRKQAAFSNLTYLLDGYILPNTFYHEGENGECGETPPAASSAIQDWVLMEWNSELHVFAGLFDTTRAEPGARALRDASFHNLRSPGAFLVSGQFMDGVTQWVEITSEKGLPLILVASTLNQPVHVSPASVAVKTRASDGALIIDLKAGQRVVLTSADVQPVAEPVAKPSAGNTSQFNKWGFPGPPKPSPPPPPPPPPPCPRPPLTGGTTEPGLPAGWLKYADHCGSNNRCSDGHDCGEDLCWPVETNAKLCAPLHEHTGQRKEVLAAARCDATPGCEHFALYSGTGQPVKYWSVNGSLTKDTAGSWTGWSKQLPKV